MKLKPLLLLSFLFALAGSRAVAQVGVPYSWGQNNNGQVGDGTKIDRWSPVHVTGLTNVVQVSAAWWHSLALKLDGTVWAWGRDDFGTLGNGTGSSTVPVQINSLSNVVQIATGYYHSLALKSDGTVWAWGWNKYGQCAQPVGYSVCPKPVQVSGVSNIVQVATGYHTSYALKSDGTVWTWGDYVKNRSGSITPVQMSSGGSVSQIAAGEYGFASMPQNSVRSVCLYGGDDLAGKNSNHGGADFGASIDVSGIIYAPPFIYPYDETMGIIEVFHPAVLTNPIQIAGGQWHALVLQKDGSVWYWGSQNGYGQFGDGTNSVWCVSAYQNWARDTPRQITTLSNQTFIAAGGNHSLTVQAVIQKTNVKISGQTVLYGTPVSFVANLSLASNGFLLTNRPVTFAIDGTVVGTGYTNYAGNTNFQFPVNLAHGVGKHTVTAFLSEDPLYSSNTAGATLNVKQTSTSLSMGSVSGRSGDTRTIKATLKRKSDGALISGVPLAFKVDGNAFGTVATDSSGVAVLTFKVDEAYSVGAHTLTVDYAGDANQSASTAKATYTVKQAPGGILGSSVSGKVGATITLKAKLIRKTDNTLLAGKTVRFQIDTVDIGTAVTDGANITTFSYTIPASLSVGTHTLTVLFDGDAFYTSDFNNKSLVVKP